MQGLIAWIEKGKPFFDKLAANKYLGAIRDGFLTAMPAILFSSLFILIASIPEIFGIVLPDWLSSWLWKIYNLSMGMVAVLVSATTAKSLADSMNRKQQPTAQLNTVSVMLASICSLLVLAVTEVDGGIDITYLGTRGLLASFIAAFVTCWMYRFCADHNITIPMPPEVPGVISSMFRNIFPFSFSVLCCCVIDIICRQFIGASFAETVITIISPLFHAADSYLGLCLIWGAVAFFWFIGIHGPSIVEPAIAAVIYTNVEMNLQLHQEGLQASYVLTKGLMDFVGNMGGTGATLIVPFLMILFMKSKQLKAVGRTSVVPVCFSVNEPLLFATPIVLNPYLFIPFLAAPMANVCLFKFFVDVLHMNSFMYVIPWSTPAPIGILLGAGFSLITCLFIVLVLLMDAVIYMPFLKAYDKTLCEQEALKATEIDEEKEAEKEAAEIASAAAALLGTAENTENAEKAEGKDSAEKQKKDLNVLVLCVGAGTSAMLANAIKKGAAAKGLPINSFATAFGSHGELLPNYDMVILSPQVLSHAEEIEEDAAKLGVQVIRTKGAQYINLTRDPEGAVDFVLASYAKNKESK